MRNFGAMTLQERYESVYLKSRVIHKENERLLKENARLMAENERLRKALEIASDQHGFGCKCHSCKSDQWWDS